MFYFRGVWKRWDGTYGVDNVIGREDRDLSIYMMVERKKVLKVFFFMYIWEFFFFILLLDR